MRKKREVSELLEASKHVAYEVFQFSYCVRRLTTEPLQQYDRALYNTIFTAYTIHARNIYGFLYAEKPYDDDIVASDYFGDPDYWKSVRPELTRLLRELSAQASKRSAHLTYVRLSEYWWLWTEMLIDLRVPMLVFVAHVQPERINSALLSFDQHWKWVENYPPPS